MALKFKYLKVVIPYNIQTNGWCIYMLICIEWTIFTCFIKFAINIINYKIIYNGNWWIRWEGKEKILKIFLCIEFMTSVNLFHLKSFIAFLQHLVVSNQSHTMSITPDLTFPLAPLLNRSQCINKRLLDGGVVNANELTFCSDGVWVAQKFNPLTF